VSEKPLVINVGDGSTATRWLAEIMGMLGFNTYHYGGLIGGTWDATFRFSNTSEADMFDFIADTPTSTLTWELVQSHPNALFLMTMRDPVDWQDSRINDHSGSMWKQQGLPCDGPDVLQLYGQSTPSAHDYVAYSAWAKCVIPQDRFLGAVNVFADENADSEFVEKLIKTLETHGLQKPDWKNRTALVRAKNARS